ncbi:MurR/RpiR family transcriptional regulator [Microbacterium sp. CIAB417]|uniref:MurR/RpiR family transcriptional regulator n=1 Tax=Microbacterium sp. CIAB417 TaxID=2860287 RepID=UPI001FAB8665|nr:MurR/RpiR family transcriptional regulator [Microbacterium sp. CIAB417]
MSIQTRIDATAPALSPALQRIAEEIRRDPALITRLSITELAERCGTSVASVVRFCRAVGVTGYAELRISLASEIGRESAQFGQRNGFGSEIGADDSLPEIAATMASLEVLAIEETIAALDFDALAAAVGAIDAADRILLFGIGASHFTAADLGHKLLRVGRNALVLSDAHEAVSSAALSNAATVAMGFSHLGSTVETLRFIETARAAGATTIGVTSARDSRFAGAVEHVLYTAVREPAFRAGAMVSRIAQLAVVDCLFLGVAQRRYGDTVDALRRTHEATRQLR